MADSKLINAKDVAKKMGIDLATVYLWASQKKIAHLRFGRRILFDEQQINEHINKHRIPMESQSKKQ